MSAICRISGLYFFGNGPGPDARALEGRSERYKVAVALSERLLGRNSMPNTVRLHRVLATKPDKVYRAFIEADRFMILLLGRIAPQQISAAAEPDWSFRPKHSAGQAFDRRIENPVFGKARIEHFDGRIGISLGWPPARRSLFFGPVLLRRGHVQITPGLRLCTRLEARLSNDVGASRVLTSLPGRPSAVRSSNGEVDTQVRCIVVKIARVLVGGRVLPLVPVCFVCRRCYLLRRGGGASISFDRVN
jgi:hypothetical protein